MNMFWKEVPFLRIVLPFVIGILIFFYEPASYWIPSTICVLLCALPLVLFNQLNDYLKIKYAFWKGIFLQLMLISAGYLVCIFHTVSNQSNWYKHAVINFDYALIMIKEEPQEKPKTRKVLAEVKELCRGTLSIATKGDVFIYFKQSEKASTLKQGDILLVKNVFRDIRSNGNPGEFDYASYCHSKNIYQTAYLKESDWALGSLHVTTFISFFDRLGERSRNILKLNIQDSISLGIAEALLMGYRNDIDPDVWQAYSNTGIVHVIAISGMHMAMIYMSVRWLLFLIPFMKRNRMLSLSLAIVFMWMFAAMTGLPPSVTRAAIMFSFLGIGEMLDRDISGLNNLAASAFCLLCINPFWLRDVGFQLSYLAVLSLLLFYSRVYNWFEPKSKIGDAIWKLMAGTIAAQILTFPLCVYYFHQFPLLFLLTNLIAVPATTIILYAEIVLIVFSWLPIFANFLGGCISLAISLLNEFVFYIGKLSFAVWSGLQINGFQTLLLFGIVILLSTWLMAKKKMYLPVALSAVFLLLCSFTIDRFHSLRQQRLIVYNDPKKSTIDLIKGDHFYSPDGDSIATSNSLKYVLQPSRLFYGAFRKDSTLINSMSSKGIDVFQFAGKRIVRIRNSTFRSSQTIQADYLILSGTSDPEADWIRSNFSVSMIIVDSSIPSWKMEDLKRKLGGLALPVYYVIEKGAFVVAL